jgi:NADH-quinone oxidoreductase subunit L
MYILVLVIPLISAILAGLFGRFLGDKGAGLMTTCLILLTSLISWFIWFEVGFHGSPTYISLGTWMEAGILKINYGLIFDSLSSIMLILVTTVSGLVHLYSTEYMNGDPHKPRFMSYLSMFTFFMVVLVTSDNYVQLFIGWEGVGLCSYLLINFWFTRIQANKSAMKAMIVNRVGDIGLALGMIILFKEFKAFDFATIFSLVPYSTNSTISFIGWDVNTITIIGILILIGAVGKSAQLGLHTWLPDAMEGFSS